MTPTPAVAPYVPSYATYTPYVSATEVFNTNLGVDVSQLVVGGNTSANQAALTDLLLRASNQADLMCLKVLAATLDVQAGEYRVFRDGTIRVPVDYTPLVSVNSVQVGFQANNLTALTDLSGVWVQKKVARIPVWGVGLQQPNLTPPAPAYPGAGKVFATVQYVSGWAHTTLASTATQGAAQLAPVSVLGIVPGLPLTLRDGVNTEVVTVAGNYVPGAATVPLTGSLQFTHSAGATLSALPPTIKTAVLNLAKWLVKARGSKAVVMPSVPGNGRGPSKTQTADKAGQEDYEAARLALLPFKRAR